MVIQILTDIHSALRYLVLLSLVVSLALAYRGWIANLAFAAGNRKFHFATQMGLNVQLIIGLVLYFLKGYHHVLSNIANLPEVARFYAIEHLSAMILAIVLINIGYHRALKAVYEKSRHMRIAIFYTIGFIMIMGMIPWPFMREWATWF